MPSLLARACSDLGAFNLIPLISTPPLSSPLLITLSVVIFQDGKMTLHLAASRGDVECLKALLDKGSDATATDKVCDEHDEQ